MPCYHPIAARQLPSGGPLSFPQPNEAPGAYLGWKILQIPCRQCHGCRLSYSRHWAARCIHHAQQHRHNSYITLTYDDNTIPENSSLRYSDFQLFIRRLRKAAFRARNSSALLIHRGREATDVLRELSSTGPTRQGENHSLTGPGAFTPLRAAQAINRAMQPKTSFYMSGEYGEIYGRPHYHALLFGIDFNDRKYLKTLKTGFKIYTSETLQTLWPHGYSSVGNLTFESAAYVSRYIMKKRTGDGETTHYAIHDLETGEVISRTKEFNQMSRAHGIGHDWLLQYLGDVYNTGQMIVRGHKQYPPRYYDKILRRLDRTKYDAVKHQREIEMLAYASHHTPERLRAAEEIALAATRTLKRGKLEREPQ